MIYRVCDKKATIAEKMATKAHNAKERVKTFALQNGGLTILALRLATGGLSELLGDEDWLIREQTKVNNETYYRT